MLYGLHAQPPVGEEPAYRFYPEAGAGHTAEGADMPITDGTTRPYLYGPQPPQPTFSDMSTMERFMATGESPVRWFANMTPEMGFTYGGEQIAASQADAAHRADAGHGYQHDPQGRPARAPRSHNLASHQHRSARRRHGAE